MLLGKGKSVTDMPYYFLCALLWSQSGMIFHTRGLVFRKALRIADFPDVMIKRTCTHERHIGINRPGRGIRKIHNLKAVLECARSLVRKHAKKLVARITQFHKLRRRHQHEHLFKQVYERIACNGHESPESQIPYHAVIPYAADSVRYPERPQNKKHHHKHDESRDELQPPLVEIVEHEDAYHTGHHIHHIKFHPVWSGHQHRYE